MLRAARVHLTVPLATSVDEAERLLAARPPRIVRNHELPYDPTASTLARTYLRLAGEDWDLPDELHDAAQAVITELVTNAVEHARTGCVLHLALDERRLHISVNDHRPDPHRLPQPGVRDGHGYGLLIVEGLSRHWGVTPHDDGNRSGRSSTPTPLPGKGDRALGRGSAGRLCDLPHEGREL